MPSIIWKPSRQQRPRAALIYFVCGNPGLIGFYADFLDALYDLLDSSSSTTSYDLYGRDLLGFSDDSEPGRFYDLEDQVVGVYEDVVAASRRRRSPYDVVLLAGHSVGAYICAQVFARHVRAGEEASQLRLQHGLLLFPTIAHLAQSRAGKRLSVIRRLPLVRISRAVLTVFPEPVLRWIVHHGLGFSAEAARVTAAWLKSPNGVSQALNMAFDEMDTILADSWDDAFWQGAATTSSGSSSLPRFFLFYGRDDHWVANHVRDEFIQRRRRLGGGGGGSNIVVDEGNLPHAFCTSSDTSWMVARKVYAWILEIDEAGSRAKM